MENIFSDSRNPTFRTDFPRNPHGKYSEKWHFWLGSHPKISVRNLCGIRGNLECAHRHDLEAVPRTLTGYDKLVPLKDTVHPSKITSGDSITSLTQQPTQRSHKCITTGNTREHSRKVLHRIFSTARTRIMGGTLIPNDPNHNTELPVLLRKSGPGYLPCASTVEALKHMASSLPSLALPLTGIVAILLPCSLANGGAQGGPILPPLPSQLGLTLLQMREPSVAQLRHCHPSRSATPPVN
ncbi:hypothetical protein BD779DRAFT_1477425 [Infundibulicybe gibba]|nr:hypothetical protein BD779DRAFT_1477425 [Infundibulicybe gibba]